MEERNTTVSPEGQGRVLHKFDLFYKAGIIFHFVQRFQTKIQSSEFKKWDEARKSARKSMCHCSNRELLSAVERKGKTNIERANDAEKHLLSTDKQNT